MMFQVGDWVRIRPFVHHFGHVVAIDDSAFPLLVKSTTGYADGREVRLGEDDVELQRGLIYDCDAGGR